MNTPTRLVAACGRASRMPAGVARAVLVALSLGAALPALAAVPPIEASKKPAFTHAPYGSGDCVLCHERSDPKNPGKVKSETPNDVCFKCHEEVEELMKSRSSRHGPAKKACINCHNPHNSQFPRLLLKKVPDLCAGCHEDPVKLATQAPVRHGVMTTERACLHCHDPHASNVESLLVALPFDLCVNCHGTDDLVDGDGVKLTNMKRLLAENPVQHKPVADKDCSSCHTPHGSDNFRLLLDAYPAKFYSPYDPANYALCFECHNKQMVDERETTTLTRFRDGKKNLHFVHVRDEAKGRTCRACHEVHAAKQPHIVREKVPYGKGGWSLPVVFSPNETGGSCEKTCHGPRPYTR